MVKLFVLLLLAAQPILFAQGSLQFRTSITGFELLSGNRVQVRGGGNLTLAGNSLNYDISVPLRRYFPSQTHFHGPAVNGENPIFSLVPFEDSGGGFIRYTGILQLDSKWIPDLRAGQWYINLHGENYENGILSGYLMPVPEPSTVVFLLLGSALFARLKLRVEAARSRR
jgi:hypothetical protein